MPNTTDDSPRMNGGDPNTLEEDAISKSRNMHSESMHVTEEEGTPGKYFDLSHARAMFMPHKTNTQEANSLDSQEELRKLSGNEIWELTQKAAVHDYKKTA